jgi:hypothetical protein
MSIAPKSSLPAVMHVAVGRVQVGSLWWTEAGGDLNLAICAKATFRMVHGAEMELAVGEPLRRAEERDVASASVDAPVELWPRLPKPELTVFGTARSTGPRSRVRLAVTREGQTVLDKRLEVLGERDAVGEPKPFTRMPITYERALGGIGFAQNPLGRGAAEGSPPPNVVDPTRPATAVACFAPVPAAFSSRKKRLGSMKPRDLAAQPMALPPAFDWEYFQAAPEDQRVGAIVGDEWLWLEGMRDDHKHFRSRLPDARAAARLYGIAADQMPDYVPLRAESLHIDAERGLVSVVWRGSHRYTFESASLIVAVGVSVSGAAIEWPATTAELAALMQSQSAPLPADQQLAQHGDTIVIEPTHPGDLTATAEAAPREAPTMPFAGRLQPRSSSPPAAEIPGAPWSASPGRKVRRPIDTLQTITTTDTDQRAIATELAKHVDAEKAAEEATRARADAEATAREAERLRVEAEARRVADAERFEAEQRAAEEAAREREAAKREAKDKASEKLMNDLYGGFKR